MTDSGISWGEPVNVKPSSVIFGTLTAADFKVTTLRFVSPQRLLELRDEIAALDPDEDPDSLVGCAAARVLALHNELITGEAA